MTYSEFLKVILTYKKLSEEISELYDMGFDLYEGKYKLMNHIESITTTVFESHYTKEGVEWIDWFIYEADYGMKDFSSAPSYEKNEDGEFVLAHQNREIRWGATDKDGNVICYSYESLYEYIQQYVKTLK
jgi:hypothetical protein